MGGNSAVRSVGERFGRLVVLDVSYPDQDMYSSGHALVTAKCDCGETWKGRITVLRNGQTKSCGCLGLEFLASVGERSKTHGMSHTREYGIWCAMLTRCHNRNGQDYMMYGGRGIVVCERWQTFINFYADMGTIPEGKSSIDRVDSNGNYEHGNCRWSTPLEQGGNTRRVRKIEYRGKTQGLSAWCRELGLNYRTTLFRVANGWSIEDAFTAPPRANKEGQLFEHNGLSLTLTGWAKHLGVGATTLHYRLSHGFPYEYVFTKSKLK